MTVTDEETVPSEKRDLSFSYLLPTDRVQMLINHIEVRNKPKSPAATCPSREPKRGGPSLTRMPGGEGASYGNTLVTVPRLLILHRVTPTAVGLLIFLT